MLLVYRNGLVVNRQIQVRRPGKCCRAIVSEVGGTASLTSPRIGAAVQPLCVRQAEVDVPTSPRLEPPTLPSSSFDG